MKRAGQALDAIAAGLALPFAAGEIGVHLGIRQPLHLHHADAFALPDPVAAPHRNGGDHLMPPPAKKRQEGRRLGRIAGLAQDAAAQGHGGIGAEHHVIRVGGTARAFSARQARA
jgi:hypothetical protein